MSDSTLIVSQYERAARALAERVGIRIRDPIDQARANWKDAYTTLHQFARAYNIPIPAEVTALLEEKG